MQLIELPTQTRLAVRDVGSHERPTVVFVHGLGADLTQFARQQEDLEDRFRTIAVSLRGHGRSQANFPKDTPAVGLMAEDLIALQEHLELGEIDLVGNSLGGLVAFEVWKRRPAMLRSVVTFGTTAALRTSAPLLWLLRGAVRLLGMKTMARAVARTASNDPAIGQQVAAMVRQLSVETYLHITTAIATYDYLDVIANTPVPYGILRCELDESINRELDPTLAQLERLDHVRVVRLAQVGHFANLESPGAFEAALVQFWQRSASARAR